MHLFPQFFGLTRDFWRFKILHKLVSGYIRLIELLASLQTLANIFWVEAHQRILLELVALIHLTCAQFRALSNWSLKTMIFFLVYVFRTNAPTLSKAGGFTNLGVDFWSLDLILFDFALVVNWGANVEHRFGRIYHRPVVAAVLLLEKTHLLLAGLLLDLVCSFYVYHFFLEFFQKLIYSWLIYSWIIRVCPIVLRLLN